MFVAEPARTRRQVVLSVYRWISIAAILLAALMWLAPADGVNSGPWATLLPLLIFGTVFACIGLAIPAALACFTLADDWRLALPAWLYTAAALLACFDLFATAGNADLWGPVGMLAGASLLAAAWAGWFLKFPERGAPG